MPAVVVSWPAFLSILAGFASLALAKWVWSFRGRPGARYWTANQIVIGIWALTYGTALLIFDSDVRQLFEPLLWASRIMAPSLILLFALNYTGRDNFTRPRFVIGFVGFWLVAFLIYMTNHIHHLAWTDYHIDPVFGAAAAAFTPQIGLYIFATAAYLFNGTAAVLILGPLISYRNLFGRQAAAVIVVLVFPTVANIAWLFRVGPTAHLDLTPIMFLVTFVGISYALFREELFEFLPATTRVANDIAINDINAAVISVSPNGRIIDFNAAAATLFDLEHSTAIGEPLDEVLAVDVPLEPTEMTVSNPSGRSREFDVDVSQIESTAGDLVGYIITFYDITDERRQQQRLAVQNRILRHNLRNGLSVVEGNAEVIRDRTSDKQVEPLVETILGTSEELLAVSEKVRRFDTALETAAAPVNVEQVCRAVVADIRERYPEADISIQIEGSPHIEGREQLLELVLEEILENGIIHNDSDQPAVCIVVDTSTPSGQTTITVEDDGPGIPDAELATLRSGDENPLSHGSSVGLWLVTWGANILGGSVSFDTKKSKGTTVIMHLAHD